MVQGRAAVKNDLKRTSPPIANKFPAPQLRSTAQPYPITRMLYLIGLGLGDETDITLRGLNALKKCSRIYLESYTSILGIPASRLEELYGKKVVLADREMVEQGAEEILRGAEKEDIGFLVVGDPFG